MDLQQQRTALRTQLLDMSRLSQRALDYSIKGYELNNSDFSRHAGSVRLQLKDRYQHIKVLYRQLIVTGTAAPSDFRFSLTAMRLNSAFYKTYKAAAHIAWATRLRIENGIIAKPAALDKLGQLVNCLVRLSTVAFFLNHAGHAETVLHNRDASCECELALDSSKETGSHDDYTRAISQDLCVIANQAHEMADAILFWLREDRALAFETEGHHALEHLMPENRLAAKNRWQPAC